MSAKFRSLTSPINEILKKNSKKRDKRVIQWDTITEHAFEKIKEELANAALLVHPEINAEIRLITDASDIGIGAVLEQYTRNSWQPLAFFSKKLTPAQKNYSTYDRELTAIYEAVKYFKYVLEAHRFKILTDRKPLTYIFSQKNDKINPRQRNQISFISQFTTWIEYIKGEKNTVADALSRVESIEIPTNFNLEDLALAQSRDQELSEYLASKKTSLKLKTVIVCPKKIKIICDNYSNINRPFLPFSLRRDVFDVYHRAFHPGVKAMNRLIQRKFVWPLMHRDITNCTKTCPDCQSSKVGRHVRVNPAHFDTPSSRFKHVHIDIVGPLRNSEGFTYLLTLIDRFSRWPEAIPLQDITSETVCRAFYEHWVSRFGVPDVITTDQGRQFESHLTQNIIKLLGCKRIRTTAYHPAANSMVERWHRSLKVPLMCHSDPTWTRKLPTVLLGLRTSVMNCGASLAEYLYGTGLQIPGEFIISLEEVTDRNKFLTDFREYMTSVRSAPVGHNDKRKVFVHEELSNCSHVFLRVGWVKKPLQRPYNGPYKVISRVNDRILKIEINGKSKHVSIENVKPAHFLPDQIIKKPPKLLNPPSVHVGTDKTTREKIGENEMNLNSNEHNKITKKSPQILDNQGFANPMENAPIEIAGSDLYSSKNDLTGTGILRGTKNIDIPLPKRTKFIPSILRRKKSFEIEKGEIDKMRVTDTASFSNILPEKSVSEKQQKHIPAILRRGTKRVTFRI